MPRLTIDIEARLAQFQDQLTSIGKSGERTAKQLDGAFSGLRSTLATFGVGLSVAGLAAFVKSGIDAADNLNKLSQKVGVSVESLSAFQYAAKLADVSAETFSTSLARLAKNAADAQAGTGDAKDAFDALKVSVTDAGGRLKGTEDLLLELADRFAGIEDGAGKTALAMKIFGRAGAELIPFLNAGRAGFEALRQEAQRLGVVISSETAKAAEEFNDNMTRLGASVDALKFKLAEGAIPALARFTEELLAAQQAAGTLRGIFLKVVSDTSDLPGEISKVEKRLANLRKLRDELSRDTVGNRVNNALFSDLETVKTQIAASEQQLAFLQSVFKKRGGVDFVGDTGLPTAGLGKSAAPALPDRERDKQFQNTIRQLEEEALKVQELTRFEETLAGIEAGRYGKLSQAQSDRLLQLAATVDLAKEDARIQKEAQSALEAHLKQVAARDSSEAQRLNDLARKYKDLIDPLQKYREQLDEIQKLREKGLLTAEQAAAAEFEINEELDKANEKFNGLKDKLKDNADLVRDLGLTFESAFENAVVGGENLREVLAGLAQDLARIAVRKAVTEPLGNAFANLLKGVFGGLSFGSAAPEFHAARGGSFGAGDVVEVGERGREVVTFDRPFNVIPNHALGGGGVTVNVNFSANTPAAVRDAVHAMTPSIVQAAVAGVRAERNRTGDQR